MSVKVSEAGKEQSIMMGDEAVNEQRKPYYVSVQAGQILEDPQAAAYELAITASEGELNRLKELFHELSSADNAQALHFPLSPFGSASDGEINAGYDETIQRIYKLLYECGTDTTKRHIETMQLL